MALDKITTAMITDDAVTAAKIPAGAIGTTEIAEGALSVHALQNTTSHTLSGTYSESKLYTSDAYVLGGDITVNSNLVLSSVKGDGSDITLTDDGTTRTITGTGVLESGSIVAKMNTDASALTGALSSAVTGSPNLNLINATFPPGHVIQTISETRTEATDYGDITANALTPDVTGMEVTITAKSANSSFLITGYVVIGLEVANRVGMILHRDGTAITGALGDSRGSTRRVTSATIAANNTYALDWQLVQCSFNYLDPALNTTQTRYTVRLCHGTGGTDSMTVNRSEDDDVSGSHMMSTTSTMTVQEIAG